MSLYSIVGLTFHCDGVSLGGAIYELQMKHVMVFLMVSGLVDVVGLANDVDNMLEAAHVDPGL